MIRPSFLILAPASLLTAAAPQASDLATRPLSILEDVSASGAAPSQPVAVHEMATLPQSRHSHAGLPLSRVEAANRGAIREPSPDDYLGAVQVYPWSDMALYRLYCAPGLVSDIALQPGETLISVAAGDTVRWIIGDTTSGSGSNRRTHILVKPSAARLSTNLVIATDRRVYHVEARSNSRGAMASIAWSYPDDALLALRGTAPAQGEPVSTAVSVDQLNFDYRIDGDNVPWRPIRAFDDGRQVFIQFPPSLAEGEAPPLFVTGDKGRAELVNYRIRGRYYVVDRLFAAAELRMGEKRKQVVRIIRGVADGRQDGKAR